MLFQENPCVILVTSSRNPMHSDFFPVLCQPNPFPRILIHFVRFPVIEEPTHCRYKLGILTMLEITTYSNIVWIQCIKVNGSVGTPQDFYRNKQVR